MKFFLLNTVCLITHRSVFIFQRSIGLSFISQIVECLIINYLSNHFFHYRNCWVKVESVQWRLTQVVIAPALPSVGSYFFVYEKMGKKDGI